MSRIDASFGVCALLGYPAHHSMGPAIHNAAFEALGLPLVYVAHDVAPADLAAAVAGARALSYRGLSITMPHKVAALGLVDEVDATAQAVGCINTVVNRDGRLLGHNSDGQGALDALERAGVRTQGRRVLVLGSGGAARAVGMTMAMRGQPACLEILGVVDEELCRLGRDVAARTDAKVKTCRLDEESLAAAVASADVLLHCTPVGMTPDTDRSLVAPELLRPDLAVFDAVYNPRRTLLIEQAAARGCPVVLGMEMFLGQAMVQFELWTGHKAPAEVMRKVIEARL
ncbi:MAG: shikimate dehydrogenase [Deltaproteobacteria bacterium]|nr:shikimate dehydrogenase [Deltaproteobacteria bacterium]